MEKTMCKYHPLDRADFFCESCQTDFCQTCTDDSALLNDINGDHLCVLCNSSLTKIKHSDDTPPFWRRLKSIYLYPLSPESIAVMVVVGLLIAFVPRFLILKLVCFLSLIHYCSICLEQTARGKLTPPDFDDFLNIKFSTLLGTAAFLFLILFIVRFVFISIGESAALITVFLFMFMFPAMIMSIAIEKNIINAINPTNLLGIIKHTGSSYFLMCLFSVIMFSSLGLITTFLIPENPSSTDIFLTLIVSCYYSLIVFHIMGYIVYQNRYKLNFEVKEKKNTTQARKPYKRLEDNIQTLTKAGYFKHAADLSAEQLRTNTESSLWEWNRCFTLTLIRRDEKKITKFLDAYFNTLYEKEQYDLMAESYVKAIKRLPSYKLKNHKIRLSLGKSLMEIGRYKTAVSLLNNFHKESKDKTQIISAYQIMAECLSRVPGYENKANQYKKMAGLLNG